MTFLTSSNGKLVRLASNWLTLFLGVFLAGTNCFSQTQQGGAKVEYDANAWREYRTLAGGFSILLPGVPREKTETIETATGKADIHTAFTVVYYKNTYAACGASYNYFPPLKDQTAVPKLLDQMVLARKVLKAREIHLGPYVGREIRYEQGEAFFVEQFFVVKDRLYQITVFVPKDPAPLDDVLSFQVEVRQRVFGSFKFLERQ